MNYSDFDINTKALYTLKEDSFGRFHTEFLPIQIDINLDKRLNNLFIEIREVINNRYLSKLDKYNKHVQIIRDFWEDISSNYPQLLGYKNYCESISSSYVDLPGVPVNYKLEFSPFEVSEYPQIKVSNNIKKQKSWLTLLMKIVLLAVLASMNVL